MKPTGNLVLATARAKKNGKYPLKVRVIYQREYHDYRTGIDLTQEEYTQGSAAKPSKVFRDIARELTDLKHKTNTIIQQCHPFTFQKFEDAFYGKAKEASNLYTIFQSYIDNLKQEGRIKTAVSYETAMNSFKEFQRKTSLHDVSPAFLKKYHQNMVERSKSITTIGIYVRSLRAVYNQAVAQGIIKKDENYPFGRHKYTIPASRNIKKALHLTEIKKIMDYQAEPLSLEDRARDLWLFSYYCNGINFKDLALLRRKNMEGDMLRFVREKTKRSSQGNQSPISCFLTDQAKAIVEKWGDPSREPNSFLFNILAESDSPEIQQRKIDQLIQTTNKKMKRICKNIGIDKNVTTYYSRHSAATILKRSGASVEQIQEALGHSSKLVTQNYLDSFEDDTKRELAKALINFD